MSWYSQNSHKSSSQLEVINKQPCPFTSPISIDDKPANYSNTAFATDVVLDLNVLFPNVNAGDISASASIEADPIAPVPVAQNLQGIGVELDIAPLIQPIPVAQGPVNLPAAINLPLDGDNNNNNNNNNDSSEDETDNIMTDSVIAARVSVVRRPKIRVIGYAILFCIVPLRDIPLRGRRPCLRYY